MTEGKAQRHPPRKTKSAVFSVRFPGDELWEVRRAAQAANVSVGELIRQAALTQARAQAVPASFAKVVGEQLTQIYFLYQQAGTPSGESLEDMMIWLDADGTVRTGQRGQVPH